MTGPGMHTVSLSLKSWILQLPEVVEAPHRFGGTQFQVNGSEFMHFHGDTFLDIRLSKEDQATVLKQGIAISHRFAPQAGWVSFRIEKAEEVERAKNVIQMAYANARSRVVRKERNV